MSDFTPLPKIARLTRDCIITEKIDGTNAQIIVSDDVLNPTVRAASRTRYITPDKDNFGFARWVEEHAEELRALGPGKHYGEWWGLGIQRGYGLTEKRFSLFNVHRWATERPACCGIVPTLYTGPFDTAFVNSTLTLLGALGSQAAPGFMKPEGIVIFHTASSAMFKKTLEKDEAPKSECT